MPVLRIIKAKIGKRKSRQDVRRQEVVSQFHVSLVRLYVLQALWPKFTIADTTGRIVQTSRVAGQNQFLITRQTPGVYFAEVIDEATAQAWVKGLVFY